MTQQTAIDRILAAQEKVTQAQGLLDQGSPAAAKHVARVAKLDLALIVATNKLDQCEWCQVDAQADRLIENATAALLAQAN